MYISLSLLVNCLRSFHTTNLRLLRIWCTTQVCMVVFGYMLAIALSKPLRLSMLVMRTSFTPLACISLRTDNQKDALSLSAIHIPSTSFLPSTFSPMTRYRALLTILPSLLILKNIASSHIRTYSPSRGLCCHSLIVGSSLLVILLISDSDSLTPYISLI